MYRRAVTFVLVPALSYLLFGCGSQGYQPVTGAGAASSAVLQGTVFGGQQAISNTTVQLYAVNTAATAGASTLLSTALPTGTNGGFSFTTPYTCPTQTATPVYIVATGGNPGLAASTNNQALSLMAALGPCSGVSGTTKVTVNEATTVAAAFALGNAMTDYTHVGAASVQSITNLFNVAAELANSATGLSPGATLPAGSYAPTPKIYTLANLLASCVDSDGSGATGNSTPCGQLFTDTAYSGTMPTETIGSAIKIAANPATGVSTLFGRAGTDTPFQPTLTSAPTTWSVPIASVAWATPSAITYGTALGSSQLDATATVPGSFSYTPAASTVLGAGTQTLGATFTATDSADYPQIPSSVSLLVNQATPSVSWATPATITAGTALSSTQLDATSAVTGSFVYTPASGTLLNDGTQTLSVAFTPYDTTDYTNASGSVSLTVNNATPSYTFQNAQIVAGGFITGIIAHPTQANLRYARTDIGGAYRWNQSTSAWLPLTDFYNRSTANDNGAESIALDPSDPTRLYMAMGEYAESFGSNGVFLLSSNQGASFTTVNASFKMGSNDNGRNAGERLAVDPNLGTILYFGSRLNGLWKSTNRGLAWSQVTSFPVTSTTSGVGVVFVDFVASSGSSNSATPVIYVGVSDTGPSSSTGFYSLYRSTDAGSTWAAVPGQPTGYFPMRGVFGPDGALYLAYSNAIGPSGATAGALYQYTLPPSTTPTGNGTWTNITPGTSARPSNSQGGFAAIAVDPERPGVLMATTLDDYYPSPGDDIYRSTNYGASWVSFNQQGATHNVSVSPWLTFGGSSASTGNWPAALVIDPLNSNHVLYGTGQTLWDSTNVNVSDSGGAVTFNVGALGIEECAVNVLMSPASGVPLVSGVGDLGGFVHTSLTASPTGGMMKNPLMSGVTGLDFAQSSPSYMVRVGSGSTTFGAYSSNGGTSWTPFTAAAPSTANGQGAVAASADGTTIVWAPSDVAVVYSTNNGTSWTVSTGATAEMGVFADRINPKKFYIYNSSTGALQISTNGGQSFATQATSLVTGGAMVASYAAEGDLWLATGSGLYHSTNSGVSFTKLSGGITAAYSVGFGMAASYSNYPTLYLIGSGSSGYGFYRSTDEGSTWVLTNSSSQEYGYANPIVGDPKTFGLFYVGTNGRGVIYGTSPN